MPQPWSISVALPRTVRNSARITTPSAGARMGSPSPPQKSTPVWKEKYFFTRASADVGAPVAVARGETIREVGRRLKDSLPVAGGRGRAGEFGDFLRFRLGDGGVNRLWFNQEQGVVGVKTGLHRHHLLVTLARAIGQGGFQPQRIRPGREHGVDALQRDLRAVFLREEAQRHLCQRAAERHPRLRLDDDFARASLRHRQGCDLHAEEGRRQAAGLCLAVASARGVENIAGQRAPGAGQFVQRLQRPGVASGADGGFQQGFTRLQAEALRERRQVFLLG